MELEAGGASASGPAPGRQSLATPPPRPHPQSPRMLARAATALKRGFLSPTRAGEAAGPVGLGEEGPSDLEGVLGQTLPRWGTVRAGRGGDTRMGQRPRLHPGRGAGHTGNSARTSLPHVGRQ